MIAALVLGLVLAADPAAAPAVISSSGLPELAAPAAPAGAAAPIDTLVRVPGSALRLGWSQERTSALGSFGPGGSAAGGEVREGEIRWFGSPARASLTYRSGRLAEARLVLSPASPRLASYVPDELRRRGYRLLGDVLTSGTSLSEWEGEAKIRLTIGGGSVTAEVSPRSVPASEEPVASAAATAGPGSEPPSDAAAGQGAPPLDFTAEGASDSLPAPLRTVTPADPVRPQLAVEAGVFGRVMVRARVSVEGLVEHAEIERGIAELNSEALEWAGGVRFAPYLHQGRTVPFVVRIPVAFLPARAAGPGGTP